MGNLSDYFPTNNNNKPTYLVSAQANVGYSGIAPTVNRPQGLQVGDLLVLVLQHRNMTITPPAGWTEEFRVGSLEGTFEDPITTSNDHLSVWSKLATASDVAASAFTFGMVDEGTDGFAIHCWAVRNAKQIRALAFSSGTLIAPSVDASIGDILFVMHGTAFDDTPGTVVFPATTTVLADVYTSIADCGIASGFEPVLSSGATGTRVFGAGHNQYEFSGLIAVGP